MPLFILIFVILILSGCESKIDDQRTSDSNITNQKLSTEAPDNTVQQESVSDDSFYTVRLYDGGLQISIPEHFIEMPSAVKLSKYPRGNSPDIVYTNEDGTVNVAFKYTSTIVPDGNISELKNTIFQQLQASHSVNLSSRLESVNGSDYAVFEFTSNALDSKIYNLMFLTELEGKMLLGTFNCTEALVNEWQPKAKKILLSIRKSPR